MPIEKISILRLLELRGRCPVLDVRSPGEFAAAHIPGAYSLPLFSDDERKVVGTVYKKESKQQAIKAGLLYFGPRMVQVIEEAERIVDLHNATFPVTGMPGKTVIVHCWRGGMRSAGVAWLLNLYGFTVLTLTGGYKSFRRWCAEQFRKEYSFAIIGGFTGSGKTGILKALTHNGYTAVDLEHLAAHKGSAFGHLGEPPQPSQEMFENKLALALAAAPAGETIWLEDESRRIGRVNIPDNLFRCIQTSVVYFLHVPFDQRLQYVVYMYGTYEKEKLAEAVIRIKKRLGGLETKNALAFLNNGELQQCFGILLKYYDKGYLKCLQQKSHLTSCIKEITCATTDANTNAATILQQHAETIF